MIVDDESLVRKGIATSINWEKYGIEVVAEAGNGKQALEKLQNQLVDLVLTDIRMPVMSGIELTRHIREHYPDIAVVLLSAYEDFTYAQSAMKLGIRNYLLKPASADELISVISEIKEQKEEEQRKKRREIGEKQFFNENLPHIKKSFMQNLLSKRLSLSEISDMLKILKIELPGPKFVVLSIDIDNFLLITKDLPKNEIEMYKYAVYNIAEETILSFTPGFVCYSDLDKLTALVCVNPKVSIFEVCKEIQWNIQKYIKLSVSIGIGLPKESLLNINESYMEANQALMDKAFYGKGNIYLYKRKEYFNTRKIVEYNNLIAEEKVLVRYFKLNNSIELRKKLSDYLSSLISQKIDSKTFKNTCVRLLHLFINQLEEIGIPFEEVFDPSFVPHIEIERFEVMKDLQQWMIETVDNMIKRMETDQQKSSKKIVSEAIAFIEAHYNQDISLSEVAAHVKVTPPYLSKLFKEELNITFVKWLNQYRIEKAKELLRKTKLKTYEVAGKVGFFDYKYFSNVFKKYTGVSPREFRNR